MDYIDAREHTVTTFGQETEFIGDLEYDTSLRICGKFHGSITTAGFLFIDKTAQVEAKIKAGSVIISGTIKGDIEAVDKVEMLPTARIYGNVMAAKIKMNDGVIFEGHLKHI